MSGLGRQVLLWMIPLNLALVLWVWLGRLLFGVAGWMVVIILFYGLPLLLLGLLVTTVLAFTQPGRPRSLTTVQAGAQLAVWASLFLVGLCVEDATDEPDGGRSGLTALIGRSEATREVSSTLAVAGSGLALASWAGLLLTLTMGRRPAPQPTSVVP